MVHVKRAFLFFNSEVLCHQQYWARLTPRCATSGIAWCSTC